jgi:hypothetical protein
LIASAVPDPVRTWSNEIERVDGRSLRFELTFQEIVTRIGHMSAHLGHVILGKGNLDDTLLFISLSCRSTRSIVTASTTSTLPFGDFVVWYRRWKLNISHQLAYYSIWHVGSKYNHTRTMTVQSVRSPAKPTLGTV